MQHDLNVTSGFDIRTITQISPKVFNGNRMYIRVSHCWEAYGGHIWPSDESENSKLYTSFTRGGRLLLQSF
jgi:N-acetylmuramoyl-L-alanine amidase CwlA